MAGKKADKSISDILALMAEWDWSRNRIDPTALSHTSKTRAWWLCAKCGHSWEARIGFRAVRGTGCPNCANKLKREKAIAKKGALSVTHSELCEEWAYDLNEGVTPDDVSRGSRILIWWRCKNDKSHVWQALLNNRAISGNGCPICKGKVTIPATSLAVLNPEISREWHPSRNGSLTPDSVRPASHKKIWWQCSSDPSHEWQAVIYSRIGNGQGCPYCAGQRATLERNFKHLYPELMQEWDYEKNTGIDPGQMLPATSKKFWWRCKRNPEHSWAAALASRTLIGAGCPLCSSQTSSYELRILAELKSIFPDTAVRLNEGSNR